PPAAALSENTASGTFKLGGKSAKLVAARAWVEKPDPASEATFTVLLLSSAPIDLATAKDDAKLLAAVKKQKLQAFKVKINDQEGTIAHQAWITPAGAEDMEQQEGLRWASWDVTTDSIVGFLTSEGERQGRRETLS